jgi:hypothetical protein
VEDEMTRRRTSPEDGRKIADYARDHVECQDCAAPPSQQCDRPGAGRSVHKARFIAAAIAVKRQDKAARTPEQAEVLAGLPKVSKAEIEAHRTPKGGYRLTREWFTSHGIPYPPPAGWRQAVEQEDGTDAS